MKPNKDHVFCKTKVVLYYHTFSSIVHLGTDTEDEFATDFDEIPLVDSVLCLLTVVVFPFLFTTFR